MKKTSETNSMPTLYGVPFDSSLWVLLPRLCFSVLLSVVIVLGIFWLYFGEINGFAVGFAAFLAVLQILMAIGFRFQNRTDLHATKPVRNDFLDKIAGWWLMACAFGTFFGWLCLRGAAMFPSFNIFFHAAAVFLTIVLPVATMLPNLRYLAGKIWYIQIPLLTLITLLPSLVGLHSLVLLLSKIK